MLEKFWDSGQIRSRSQQSTNRSQDFEKLFQCYECMELFGD